MDKIHSLSELLLKYQPLAALAVVLLTFLVGYIFRRIYFRRLKSVTPALRNTTGYKFMGHLLSGIIYLVGFALAVFTIPSLRSLAGSMLAGAGIATVVLGFASQNALSNIISGLFIVIFKPFQIGDRLEIKAGELAGMVDDITLRHTVIRDYRNRRIVIPNSIISDEVIVNSDMAESLVCRWLEFGISYDSDIDLAKKIISEEVAKHPFYLDRRTPEDLAEGRPLVSVRVIGLGDSSVNLRAWAWAENAGYGFDIFCDVTESVKKRFDAEGIEIPFPHRTIVMKNPVKTDRSPIENLQDETKNTVSHNTQSTQP